MLTLSFIHLHWQVYNIHNCLPGLLGYLILFATQAFVPQRQFIHKGLLLLLSVRLVSKNFISTPIVLIYTSHIKLQYICSLLGLDMPSRYPLNLIKMNNTSLPRIAATAGTRFGQDIQIENCHYQYSIQNFIRRSRNVYVRITLHILTFLQVAGSAVRLLTNIPHCCTIRIGVFSDPMWSINLSVSTTGLSQLSNYLNYYLPEKIINILKRKFFFQ